MPQEITTKPKAWNSLAKNVVGDVGGDDGIFFVGSFHGLTGTRVGSDAVRPGSIVAQGLKIVASSPSSIASIKHHHHHPHHHDYDYHH